MPRCLACCLFALLLLAGGCRDAAQPPGETTPAAPETGTPTAKGAAFSSDAGPPDDPEVVTQLEEAGVKLTRNAAGQITGVDASEVPGGLRDEQLSLLGKLAHLTHVNLDYSQVTNDGLAQVAALPTIKVLSLRRCGNINDAGLEHLTQLPQLEQLRLLYNSSSITDEGMVPVGKIATLRLLDLRGCTQIGDAGLAHLAGLTNLVDLKVQSGAIGDEGVANLSGMTKLRNLALEKTRVTNDGLAALEPLRAMQALNLYSTPVDDDGLVHLAGMTQLKDVKLRDTATQGTGLVHLHPARESLWRLDLSETFMTDDGLANVSELVNLESLNLWYTGVTDAGLPHLVGLSKLRELNLEKCDVSDAGLAEIAGLTALESLNLSNTNITDEGLKVLEPLTNLKTLQLGNTQVSDETIEAFEKAVPGCKVEQ